MTSAGAGAGGGPGVILITEGRTGDTGWCQVVTSGRARPGGHLVTMVPLDTAVVSCHHLDTESRGWRSGARVETTDSSHCS